MALSAARASIRGSLVWAEVLLLIKTDTTKKRPVISHVGVAKAALVLLRISNTISACAETDVIEHVSAPGVCPQAHICVEYPVRR